MKSKAKDLDVDVIGGQGSLTKEEEQKISEYLRTQKLLKEKKQVRVKKASPRRKVVA